MGKYLLRDAKEEDALQIGQLYEEVERGNGVEHMDAQAFASCWRWLLRDNPWGTRKSLVGADGRGRVVGHLAMTPFKFQDPGGPLLGGFICQLLVAEDFRKELLFPRMEVRLLAEYRSSGMGFVYGLVNRPRVLKAHLALGFRQLGVLPVYARPYKLAGLARYLFGERMVRLGMKSLVAGGEMFLRSAAHRRPKNVALVAAEGFDFRVDRFFEKVRGYFPRCAIRSSEVLNWRFVSAPNRRYRIRIAEEGDEISGYVVTRRMRMRGFEVLAIVDLLFSPDRSDVARALLRGVHDEAVESGVEMCACLLNPHGPLAPRLRRHGYFKTPESFALIVHEGGGRQPGSAESPFAEWHVTWFDHDYV